MSLKWGEETKLKKKVPDKMIRVVITYGNDRNVITVKNALKIDTEQPIYVMTVKMNSSETSKTWNKTKGIGITERLSTAFRQTANVNLYHVTRFPRYLSFSVHYNYTKISRFTPILSMRTVSSWFYLLISHFENFSIKLNLTFVVCRKRDALKSITE